MSDIAMKAAALRNLGEVIYKRNLSDYNRIRENQGLQTKLEEMYKPLLTSQKSLLESSKATSAKEIEVMKEASEQNAQFQNSLLQKSNEILAKLETKPELMLLYSKLEKFPRVIAKMKGEDVLLSNRDQEVYNIASELPEQDKTNILKYYTVAREEADNLIAELADEIKLKPDLLESFFVQIPEGETAEKQLIMKSLDQNELKKLKSMLAETYVKEVLSNQEKRMQLLNTVQDYPESVKFNDPLWRSIKKFDRGLYDEAQRLRNSEKIGEGISVTEFLSDNADVLKKELARLIGSFKSGNLDVFNKINDITNHLYRTGEITKAQLKSVFSAVANLRTSSEGT
jgi:hypothetical protein